MYSNPRLKVNVVDIRINQDQNDLEIDNPLLIKRSFELLSEQLETSTREQAKVQRQCAFTNCWYRSEHESSSQWKTYGAKGVALKTSVGKLKDCFNRTTERVYIFNVKYIDYDNDMIPLGNAFYPLIHKPIHFVSEKELRAIIWYPPTEDNKNRFKEIYGIYVSVDLSILFDSIYLHPEAPDWMFALLNKILKRYGHDRKVKKSKLSEKPK